MRVAGFAANDGLEAAPRALPPIAGIDLESTVDRVAAWGGSPNRYRHVLGTALDTAPDGMSAGEVRSTAALAAWRSGVLRMRPEALRVVADLPVPVAEAALTLRPGRLAEFLAAQSASPFGHPDVGPLIARVGGFRGLGGTWFAPPRDAAPVDVDAFTVRSGDELWLVRADVFGARLVPVDAPPTSSGRPTVVASTSADSYLVTIHRDTA